MQKPHTPTIERCVHGYVLAALVGLTRPEIHPGTTGEVHGSRGCPAVVTGATSRDGPSM